jgi:hypothetical protein
MNQIREVSGLVTEDPLRNAPIGAKLNISPSLFSGKPTANDLNSIANWDFFEGAVVGLSFGGMGRHHMLGSGASVAPGIVMAARHVVEPRIEELMRGEHEIMCSGIAREGLVLWRCKSITLAGNTDIAFLMVEAASTLPKTLHQVTLTTRMPRIGEHILIVGMRHHATLPVAIDDEIKMSMMTAVGQVTARYERMRDSVLLPHPCFEVDCAAVGGMSGGPAFDKDGFLIGIVTSSVESDRAGPTFLSMPWPALAETLNPTWPSGFYKAPTSLLEINYLVCGIHRRDTLEIHEDKSSGQRILTYHHWDT